MKTAAAYARYSTDKQTENSIAYQLEEIRKYCGINDLTLIATFIDEGETGTNADRPGFQALLSAANRHEFNAIVIYDISRGSRDVADWFQFRKSMMILGIEVISATQQLGDITNPNSFLIELINTGLGQHAVLDTRQKSINGVAVKAKEGVFLGGVPPLGYDIIGSNYVINENEADIVKKIFSMYASGSSYNEILDTIGYFKGKRGQQIGKNSIHSILRNERYIGIYTWNKRKVKMFRKWAGGAPNPDCVRIENSIPAIIDKTTWEKVQDRMDDRKKNASNKAKRKYLLSGLIECEACGASYVGHTTTNSKGYETRCYCCGNKYRTRTCTAKNINANEIEEFVIQNLKAYFLDTDFTEAAQYIADKVNNSTPDLKKERFELRSINTKINNGVEAILNGVKIPELDAELDRLRVRKSELEDIIGRRSINVSKVNPEDILKLFQNAIENWNEENLPTIITQHITKIYAHTDGTYTVNVGVHINGCGGGI